MKILRPVEPHERLPRWYGVVYQRVWCRDYLAAPIPLNLILRVGWSFWLWLKHPIRFFDAAHQADYWRRLCAQEKRTREDLEWWLESARRSKGVVRSFILQPVGSQAVKGAS